MNDRKFAFIICANNERYLAECRYYIDRLRVPEGCETDILVIREADSMCAGYNLGMRSTDAKYKIYLHQDVFIRNENFLHDIRERFLQHPEAGMIGMIGGTCLPTNGIVYDFWDEGKVDTREPDMAYYLCLNERTVGDVAVEAVDGLMIVTQYDIPWREDLFTHFDYYDVSQALEFKKAGYRVLVPYQETPWAVHDCGFCKLGGYDADREIFLAHYAEFLSEERESGLLYNREWDELSGQLSACIREMTENGEWTDAAEALRIYHQKNFKDTQLEILSNMTEIHRREGEAGVSRGFFEGLDDYQKMYEKYLGVRFLLRRMELGFARTEYEALVQGLISGAVSYEAAEVLIVHSIVDKEAAAKRIQEIYREAGQQTKAKRAEHLARSAAKLGIPVAHGRNRER